MIMINEKGIVQKLEITTGSSQLHDTVTEKSVTFAWKMDTRPNYTMIDKHLVKKAQQSMWTAETHHLRRSTDIKLEPAYC